MSDNNNTNNNTSESTKQSQKNPSVSSTGAASVNKTKVVSVPQDNNSINKQQQSTSSSPPPSGTVQQSKDDPDDLDIEKFIQSNTQEIKTGDERQQERKRKMEILTKAINAKDYFERIIYNNQETGEFVGTKIRYTKDPYGKTIYDYMSDPVIQEHIEFVAAEGDPMDGSPISKQITFFWKKPTF